MYAMGKPQASASYLRLDLKDKLNLKVLSVH